TPTDAPWTRAGLRPASGSSGTTTAPAWRRDSSASGSSQTATTSRTSGHAEAARTVSAAIASASSIRTSGSRSIRVLATASRFTGTTIAHRSDPAAMSGILAIVQRPRQRLGFWYRLVICIVKPLMLLLTKRDWHGAENIPSEGGIIVAANHVSEMDPVVVGHFLVNLRRAPRFLAKAELFRKPPMKWIVEGAKQIPVNRLATDASAAVAPAVDALENGECVLIYPEGSATRDPNLWPMKARTGVARVALMSGAPVIPSAMWGPQDVL